MALVMMQSELAPPTGPVDSSTLFTMGFEPNDVGRALVATRGDAAAALAMLRGAPEAAATPSELSQEEEDRLLAEAIQMSLGEPPRAKVTAHRAPGTSSDAGNPLWAPPRYLPKDANALEHGPRTLSLSDERVSVRDGGYAWQPATAFLDTGNQLMTLVDTQYARRHALYRAEPPGPLGRASAWGHAERWTTIQGVVPGASTRAPVVTIALKVRDQEMTIEAAVCEMPSHDLLIGKEVLGQLFAAGFRIGAGSM